MFPASPTGGTWCVCVGTLFEVVVSFALLSDFTPSLFVSARRVAVSFTGVSRCRQLAATLPSIDGNGQSPNLKRAGLFAKWKIGFLDLVNA